MLGKFASARGKAPNMHFEEEDPGRVATVSNEQLPFLLVLGIHAPTPYRHSPLLPLFRPR